MKAVGQSQIVRGQFEALLYVWEAKSGWGVITFGVESEDFINDSVSYAGEVHEYFVGNISGAIDTACNVAILLVKLVGDD